MQQLAPQLDQTDTFITSLTGKTWHMRAAEPRLVQQAIQDHDLSPLVAQILVARGFTSADIANYLQPKLRQAMPDPFMFKEMDKAVARITQAIINKEKIAVFGDYDVDGATSSALMLRFLRHYGLQPTLYIPDRMTEGYGPNVNAFKMLHDDGHTLIITLDCGVMAFEPMRFAYENGLDVVILDHHMAAPELPPAVAIVNPNRLDENGQFGYLAACGVTFMTLVALTQRLRTAINHIEPLDLLTLLDLVALGTVCDVVPLIDLNRAFVAQGLKVMRTSHNIGLRALAATANLDGAPNAYHMGFVLGPRINAGGRIAVSQLGATLLSTTDEKQAITIAQQLDVYNRERQEIERRSVEEAIGIVEQDNTRFSHAIILAHRDWHPGVIGLIAARIKEQYQRPTCVIALDENGKGKASARSINGIDLGALVLKARMAGLILDGGGHAMAAGFSLYTDQIAPLQDFLTAELTAQFGPALPPPRIDIDGVMAPKSMTLSVVKQLQQLEPFGAHNPSPKIMLSHVRLQRITVLKEKHLRLSLTDDSNLQRFDAMMFNVGNTPLYQQLQNITPQQPIALLGSLKNNSWQGRETPQFIADDIALME